MRLVLETQPRQPRLCNPKVDRDLETICLKCLEKEPAKRYGSAEAVAEEIERFLRHEPIQLRRSSRLEHVWRWCKRKPLVASLVAALILVVAIGSVGVLWELRRVRKERELVRRANLSEQETACLEAEQTKNPAAYDAYLRGRAFPGWWHQEGAIQLFQEAVKLDPNFVQAWAYLSIGQSGSYWLGTDPSPARLAAAKDALAHALALAPDLPETHLALGYYRYHGQRIMPGRWRNSGKPNRVFRTALMLSKRWHLSNGGLGIGTRRLRSNAAPLSLILATAMPPSVLRLRIVACAVFPRL